jgi:hypothetical protein
MKRENIGRAMQIESRLRLLETWIKLLDQKKDLEIVIHYNSESDDPFQIRMGNDYDLKNGRILMDEQGESFINHIQDYYKKERTISLQELEML